MHIFRRRRCDSHNHCLEIFRHCSNLRMVSRLRIRHSRLKNCIKERGSVQLFLRNIIFGRNLYIPYDLFCPRIHCISEQCIGEKVPHLFMVEVPASLSTCSMQLNCRYGLHHSIQDTALHRQSHRHIDVLDMRGDRIQDRNKKALIRKHDRAILSLRNSPENIGNPLGLADRRRDAHYIDRRNRHTFRIPLCRLPELPDILFHEE